MREHTSPRHAAFTPWRAVPASPGAGTAAPRFVPQAGDVGTPAERPDFTAGGGSSVPDALLREARAQAAAAGYADGLARGREAARRETDQLVEQARAARSVAAVEAREQARRAVAALARAAAVLEQQAVATARDVEQEIVDAVGAVSEALLGHALDRGWISALDAVRRALAPLSTLEPVTVALHPDDLEVLQETGLPDSLDGRPLTVVADPGLARGDATASSGATRVEARLGEGLARALAVLSS